MKTFLFCSVPFSSVPLFWYPYMLATIKSQHNSRKVCTETKDGVIIFYLNFCLCFFFIFHGNMKRNMFLLFLVSCCRMAKTLVFFLLIFLVKQVLYSSLYLFKHLWATGITDFCILFFGFPFLFIV